MSEFKKYKRTQIAEMRPVTEWDIKAYQVDKEIYLMRDTEFKVSISDVDRQNGSPKIGDMIARNPKNHNDQWLVAEDYYKANFEILIPKELEEAQKYINDCNKDMGFMGSPKYYEQKKIVEDFFKPIREEEKLNKEREEYNRLKKKFESN